MATHDALVLTIVIVGVIALFWDTKPRKKLFGAVLTKGKKGAFGLSLTPVRKAKKRRKKR